MRDGQRQLIVAAAGFNLYPRWSPRFWCGMKFTTWSGLLRRNNYRVAASRIPRLVVVTLFTLFSSIAAWYQSRRYGRRLRDTVLRDPPIFIIGHWRSGTTYLHELLCLDGRFGGPTIVEVFFPHGFLVLESLLQRVIGFVLPAKRPMDDVDVTVDRPQEDEWALCNMGIPTPYQRFLFPGQPAPHLEFIDMEGVPPDKQQDWAAAYLHFMKMLTLRQGRRLVLKSPLHTARIPLLLKMFPRAQFVHIVRNPYEVVPSTIRTWQLFDDAQGLQLTDAAQLEEFVLGTHVRIYRSFERNRGLLGPAQLCEIRYEALIRDPVEVLEKVYATLGLGGFQAVRPAMLAYVHSKQSHRPNCHELSGALRARISRQLADFINKYGFTEA